MFDDLPKVAEVIHFEASAIIDYWYDDLTVRIIRRPCVFELEFSDAFDDANVVLIYVFFVVLALPRKLFLLFGTEEILLEFDQFFGFGGALVADHLAAG